MKLPPKCLIDTNVPLTANLATNMNAIPEELLDGTLNCVDAIESVMKKGGLVLDAGGEIFEEYRHKLHLSGQPGMGDGFLKWVHDNLWNESRIEQVSITGCNGHYDEFPGHEGLSNFDRSDRKFVATAAAHDKKPPILEATDSKWLGWRDALKKAGITVIFLCPDYIRKKYFEKFGIAIDV